MTPPNSAGQQSSSSGSEGLEEHELEGVNPEPLKFRKALVPSMGCSITAVRNLRGQAGRSDRLILTLPLSCPWGCIVDGKRSCATQEGCPIAMGWRILPPELVAPSFFFQGLCQPSWRAVAGIRAIGGQALPSVITGLSGCPTSLVWS